MAPNKERVVVTGIGVVSSVGIGKDAFWTGLLAGKSGVTALDNIPEKYRSSSVIGGQIKAKDFDPLTYMDAKQIKRTDRYTQLAIAASKLAVEDAKIDLSKEDPGAVGVVVGSAAGGFSTFEAQHLNMLENGPRRCSPFTVPNMIVNMAAGWISIIHNAQGPNSCSVTACATAANSIGDAYHIIQRGEAEVMFGGGAEAVLTPFSLAGFSAARTLSTRNDEPEKASRPFDIDRDGFVMSEGAGILILESLSHAKTRGAHIYAEIIGFGQSADAFEIVQPCPDGAGAARAMVAALKSAGIKPDDVSYINAHGTSTPLGDKAETMAIKKVFGQRAIDKKLPVSSTKSMTGHLLGAAGGVEAAACIMAIQDSALPPTINLDNPDPECDLDYVPNVARRNYPVNVAISNSFGFGGHNACLVFAKYKD